MSRLYPFLAPLVFTFCTPNKDMNELSKSTSPYLLQHAENPVHWKEWSAKVLHQAIEENKPILVSIGYSSCHWCHVMEKESFEDTAVARIMNEHFINIKVDREERPDVDHIYMEAVQTMGINGGWPLNVFLTPEQKPFYGGTYFPKEGWKNLLTSITDSFQNNRAKIDESAEAFTKNLQLQEGEKYKLEGKNHRFTPKQIEETFYNLSLKFDLIDGGIKKSPKFPMPSIWQFLASIYSVSKNEHALTHLEFTLEKIADGGIYDHVGGGFARYSTDEEWHVPHFEKMLYDNGQLLSLYANGYKITKNEKFKTVLLETIGWLRREMLDETGGFYSALDADSEGVEGKFYVWGAAALQKLAGDDFKWLSVYFDIKAEGNWLDTNVLRVVKSKAEIEKQFGMSANDIDEGLKAFKKAALGRREKRARPGLDYKIIAGWNGLTLTGLSIAYQAIQDESILVLAQNNAEFIKNQLVKNGKLNRFPNKNLEGFMEDYASVIQSFIQYYETTLEREYLDMALQLTKRANDQFYDPQEKLYFFTSRDAESLIARKKELFDNVISSSNSIMTWNLIHLGTHLYDDEMISKGKTIIANVKDLIIKEPEYMSNWAISGLEASKPMAEIIILGPEVKDFTNKINQRFIPNKIISGSEVPSQLPPFMNKTLKNDQTTIYVCFDKSCKLPVTTVEKALDQLNIREPD